MPNPSHNTVSKPPVLSFDRTKSTVELCFGSEPFSTIFMSSRKHTTPRMFSIVLFIASRISFSMSKAPYNLVLKQLFLVISLQTKLKLQWLLSRSES